MNDERNITQTGAAKLPRYRLYIDESGDHIYNLIDDPSRRYLGLLGVWFRQTEDYLAFSDNMDRFKRDIFGPRPDKPVILHRTDIINRRGAFGSLSNPDKNERFNAGLLGIIKLAQFKMVCVVIDKLEHLEEQVSPFHPYHYCLAAMLDRYSGWLNYKNAVGDVLAESRGREEDLQLKQAYRRLYESGTLMFDHRHHQRALTSRDIKIQPKSGNIAGLQLADIMAYPIKQAMLIEKGKITDPGDNFGKQLYEVAKSKFNINDWKGQVEGYGKVWLPRIK